MRLRINLLPPERKQQAVVWLRFRFVIKQCINLSIIALLAFGIIWGAGWLLREQFAALQVTSGSQHLADTSRELLGYQDTIKQANMAVQEVIEREKQHPRWSRLFQELESLTPDAITLESVMNVDYRVSIAGRAANRDALMSFRDKLTQSDCFEDVQLPLSNLFSQEAIDFQMDMTFKRSCLKPFSV